MNTVKYITTKVAVTNIFFLGKRDRGSKNASEKLPAPRTPLQKIMHWSLMEKGKVRNLLLTQKRANTPRKGEICVRAKSRAWVTKGCMHDFTTCPVHSSQPQSLRNLCLWLSVGQQGLKCKVFPQQLCRAWSVCVPVLKVRKY